MYAEAFFESDPERLIEAGLKCIPANCMYAEMIRDMLRWHRENPQWEKTWDLVVKKYRLDRKYYVSQLDVKQEGAFVLMGLLYGGGDLDKTITISCRCGSDSDCNPSSSGGVLFTTRGLSKLPERYYRKLDETKVFSYTSYNFPALLAVCERLARQAVVRAGGRIEKDAAGEEVFGIPIEAPRPSKFEDLKNPDPIAGSTFTDEEMSKIHSLGLKWGLDKYLPSWQTGNYDLGPSCLVREFAGKTNVVVIAPREGRKGGWTLSRKVDLPAGKKSMLKFLVGVPERGQVWDSSVKADGEEIWKKPIERQGQDWQPIEIDLSARSGKTVNLEIVGLPAPESRHRASVCYLADMEIATSATGQTE
jgi:hypothetical protein